MVAHGIGQVLTGERMMPASAKSWMSWRSARSPGFAHGSAQSGVAARARKIAAALIKSLLVSGMCIAPGSLRGASAPRGRTVLVSRAEPRPTHDRGRGRWGQAAEYR